MELASSYVGICVSLDIASENYLFSSLVAKRKKSDGESENIYFLRDTLICFSILMNFFMTEM